MSIVPDDTSNHPESGAWLAPVTRELQRPVALGDGYLDRAMAELGALPAPRRPRPWRALAGLALAAGLVAAIGLGLFRRDPDGGAPVRFALDAPAGAVALVGDFNDWDPRAQPLTRQNGAWSVTLRLPPGRYRYAFVADGDRWLNDPSHPAAPDEFGTPTSVITVAN